MRCLSQHELSVLQRMTAGFSAWLDYDILPLLIFASCNSSIRAHVVLGINHQDDCDRNAISIGHVGTRVGNSLCIAWLCLHMQRQLPAALPAALVQTDPEWIANFVGGKTLMGTGHMSGNSSVLLYVLCCFTCCMSYDMPYS